MNSTLCVLEQSSKQYYLEWTVLVRNYRRTLEEARRFRPVDPLGAPLTYINGHVTNYCVGLLTSELKRMKKLWVQVNHLCGHVMRTTRGLPCACEMYQAFTSKSPLRMNNIHEFWTALVIEDPEGEVKQENEGSEDLRFVHSLVDDLAHMDQRVAAEVGRKMHETMHPDKANYGEPDVKDKIKGRPRESTSTMRLKSWWGKTKSVAKGRGSKSVRGSASCRGSNSVSGSPLGRGSPSGHGSPLGRGSPLVQGSPSDRGSPTIPNSCPIYDLTSLNIYDSRFLRDIPEMIRQYVMGYLDIVDDGNSGFHVVADCAGRSQNLWPDVRRIVVNEILSDLDLYNSIYVIDSMEHAIERITWSDGGYSRIHWMQITDDLFPIATAFNITIILIQPQAHFCITILPLWAPVTTIGIATAPTSELFISFIGGNHFVRLHL